MGYALFGFLILATLILPWWQHFRINQLQKELDDMQSRITKLTLKLMTKGAVKTDDMTEKVKTSETQLKTENHDKEKAELPKTSLATKVASDLKQEDIITDKVKKTDVPKQQTSAMRQSKPAIKDSAKQHKEYNLAAKLPVWIGSISLIFAAFFLIKYSIEQGLLGPAMRVTLGAVFGVGLLLLGQYLTKRDDLANAERMAQGVVGSGIVTLYFVFYAATNMYDFIPHITGFVSMVCVTAIAMWMSMRHGRPIAVFGIIGGVLTPALMATGAVHTLLLFAYLFVLTSGMFWVFARQKWWGLAAFSIIGAYMWVIYWFGAVFDANEAFVLMFFTLGLAVVVMVSTSFTALRMALSSGNTGTQKLSKMQHGLNIAALAVAVVTIYAIGAEVTLGFFDWAVLALPTLALYALSYIQPKAYQYALMAKMVTSLLLFAGWSEHVGMYEMGIVMAGFVIVYGAIPYWFMRRGHTPLFHSLLQVLALYGVFMITYAVKQEMMDDIGWGAIAMAMAAAFLTQVKYAKLAPAWQKNVTIQNGLMARYALAVTGFISTALVIVLPSDYYALAFAGQIAATAYMYDRYEITALKKMMIVLFGLFALFNVKIFALMTGNIVTSLLMDTLSQHTARDLFVTWPSVTLGLSLLFMGVGYHYLSSAGRRLKQTMHKLLTSMRYMMAFLALTTLYLTMREILDVPVYEALTFMQRAFITSVFAMIGYVLSYGTIGGQYPVLHQSGRKLLHLALARFVYFDLLFLNPYWASEQWVGDMVGFNAVTWVYGGATALIGWGFWRGYVEKLSAGLRHFYKVTLLAAVFAFVTLSVRQAFHGGQLTMGVIDTAELYAYSAVWLITGLLLLTVGIRGHNHAARMASVGFIGMTVCKVFFVDAAALGGIWRIASFMGLGVCLIGLSHFYAKYVFVKTEQG